MSRPLSERISRHNVEDVGYIQEPECDDNKETGDCPLGGE
jgi:hypothetical protein